MDIQSYCDNVGTELIGWKSKLYDVVQKFDKLPTGDKEKLVPEVNDLHMILEELTERIQKLEKECPTEWDPHREKIEGVMSKLRDRWESAWDTMSGADIGG